jgi:hypothetical protein
VYAVFVVKSQGNISTEFIHGPIDNPWEYFHAPRASKLNIQIQQMGKLYGKITLHPQN